MIWFGFGLGLGGDGGGLIGSIYSAGNVLYIGIVCPTQYIYHMVQHTLRCMTLLPSSSPPHQVRSFAH